jgi:hypothetical protein
MNDASISCFLSLSGEANRALSTSLVIRRNRPRPAESFSEGMMSFAMNEMAKKLARKGIVDNVAATGRWSSIVRNYSSTSLSCSRNLQVRPNARSEMASMVKKEAFSAKSMGLMLELIVKYFRLIR